MADPPDFGSGNCRFEACRPSGGKIMAKMTVPWTPCDQHPDREASHTDVVAKEGRLVRYRNCPDCHLRFARLLGRFPAK